MEVLDGVKAKFLVHHTLKKHACHPEHNYDWYAYSTEPDYRAYFVNWPDGTALLTHRLAGEWYIFSEPLAPPDKAATRICEFIDYALKKPSVEKIWLELGSRLRREVLGNLSNIYRAHPINYTLTWPVINMDLFDPTLPGKKWKSIRNARNAFYREHNVKIIPARELSKHSLHALIDRWKLSRMGHDRAYTHAFHAIIDGNFAGTKSARAMMVDGSCAGLNAGWDMPHKKQFYYGAVGIHDYSIRDLGVVLFLEDLHWIKNNHYRYVDMAGGEKKLTAFKNQFQPEYSYKTHVFSVVRNGFCK